MGHRQIAKPIDRQYNFYIIEGMEMGGFGSFFSWCIVHWLECLLILLGLSYFYYLFDLYVLQPVLGWITAVF